MQYGLVLLVNRHPGVLDGIRKMLEREVASVIMVADEVSLMQVVERTIPDLVIVDLSLPVSGAANVVQLLRNRFPDLRIIVTSVHSDRAVLEEVMLAGAAGFVLQRRIVVDLLPALRDVWLGRRYVSPDVEQRERWCAAAEHENSTNGTEP